MAKVHLYPETSRLAYIHTKYGTKTISLKRLFKKIIVKNCDIAFVNSNYLYYKEVQNKLFRVEIPEHLKLFVILKNEKAFLFGIDTTKNAIVKFENLPNSIAEENFRYICLGTYKPRSAKDAADKIVSMPFTRKFSFETLTIVPVDMVEFITFLSEE